MTLADRLIVMNSGIVEQVGKPSEVYHHPASLFVADFIGSPSMNLVRGFFAEDGFFRHGQGGMLSLPGLAKAHLSREVSIGVRPELVRRVDAGHKGAIAAVVDYTEELGASRLIYARVDGSPIIAVDDGNDALGTGMPVHFAVNESDVHVFDHTTGRRIDQNGLAVRATDSVSA
jgi:sn-glycerol 3-phosphate transport system ATP-binding protein